MNIYMFKGQSKNDINDKRVFIFMNIDVLICVTEHYRNSKFICFNLK